MEVQARKQYPSEFLTEDPRRLETQVRVFKRWLNSLLKQANAREVIDILDIFRDTKNLYYLCKHLAGQRLMTVSYYFISREPFGFIQYRGSGLKPSFRMNVNIRVAMQSDCGNQIP
ncbi:Spectrin beta chain brain 2 [Fasciola gigantica]|uniref:Spectrin beta chain brain 2 n=1 Tax=Fasciola gigantica TaxID=46835 RepID=A0A504Y2T3_FASGI|nr:Spectrin beta chain brain 2 [Fasciola gigantica]